VVGTDHCSFTIAQKRIGRNDFRMIPNGTGGLEDRMPVLWTAGVNSGRLTPNEFVAVSSTNAARILNMYPQKGVVMPGADADIVIWDPAATKTISAKSQVSRIEYNVFEGYALKGLPVKVYLRGRLAAENGQVRAERGQGRFVSRRPLPPFAEALRAWKSQNAPRAVAR
jgi:dihydropyrimidinase